MKLPTRKQKAQATLAATVATPANPQAFTPAQAVDVFRQFYQQATGPFNGLAHQQVQLAIAVLHEFCSPPAPTENPQNGPAPDAVPAG